MPAINTNPHMVLSKDLRFVYFIPNLFLKWRRFLA
jgi:hypothetical protein